MSQSQLGEMIGMSDKNIGNIENGKQFPAVNNFIRIIDALNLSLEDFGAKKRKKQETIKDDFIKKILSMTESKCLKLFEIFNTIEKYIE